MYLIAAQCCMLQSVRYRILRMRHLTYTESAVVDEVTTRIKPTCLYRYACYDKDWKRD